MPPKKRTTDTPKKKKGLTKPKLTPFPKVPKANASLKAWEAYEEKCEKTAATNQEKMDEYFAKVEEKKTVKEKKEGIKDYVKELKDYKAKAKKKKRTAKR